MKRAKQFSCSAVVGSGRRGASHRGESARLSATPARKQQMRLSPRARKAAQASFLIVPVGVLTADQLKTVASIFDCRFVRNARTPTGAKKVTVILPEAKPALLLLPLGVTTDYDREKLSRVFNLHLVGKFPLAFRASQPMPSPRVSQPVQIETPKPWNEYPSTARERALKRRQVLMVYFNRREAGNSIAQATAAAQAKAKAVCSHSFSNRTISRWIRRISNVGTPIHDIALEYFCDKKSRPHPRSRKARKV